VFYIGAFLYRSIDNYQEKEVMHLMVSNTALFVRCFQSNSHISKHNFFKVGEELLSKQRVRRKVDIIYNTTLICPWDCAVCCVDAVHVKKNGDMIDIAYGGLGSKTSIQNHDRKIPIYDQALQYRQLIGQELDIHAKKRIIDNLSGFDAKIDISGGDALSVSENFELLKYAFGKLGRSNVTLTATGSGSGRYPAKIIAPYIGEYNFTFDAASLSDVALRPEGYAAGNLKKAMAFVKIGVPTRAEVPLNKAISSVEHLERLYMTLHKAGIHKILVMRLFPVGRGNLHENEIPSPDEYRSALNLLHDLEKQYHHPLVKIQCALKHLVKNAFLARQNPCDLVTESFGLMADGTLLASPWAIGSKGEPLGKEWILGNLATTPLAEILDSQQTSVFYQRSNENYGHCKIFSYLSSSKKDPLDRIFDQADPLYISTLSSLEASDA